MPIEQLQILKKAYEWEQARIQTWVDDLNQHSFNDNDGNPNQMVARFYEIWIAYFKEIAASNQGVINICNEALANGSNEAVTQAINNINNTYHERPPLATIEDTASFNKGKSRYFDAIDNGLILELNARDQIQSFLTNSN